MAADLNVIYKISADISGLKDGVDKAAKAAEGLESLAFKVGGALAGMFTVQAAIGFGKVLLADADALVKLSDKTGVSLQGLQRFQIAADDAGNTVDDLTSAIVKMEDKLAGGDKSALAALNKLGIPFQDIKNLSPENQFIAISDAIRQIQDPAQQVAIAIDLFGKQGATVLPTLKRGFDDVKNAAVGMSDETVRALDEAGDTLTRWGRTAKGIAAEAFVGFVHVVSDGITPMAHALGDVRREAEAAKKELQAMVAAVPTPKKDVAAPLPEITLDTPRVARAIAELDDPLKKVKKSTDEAAEAQKRFEQSIIDATIAARLSVFTLHRFGAFELPAVTSSLNGVDTELHTLASTTLPDFGISLYDIGKKGVKSFGDLRTSGQKMADSLKSLLQSVPQTLANAFTGGGGLLGAAKSLASQFGSVIGDGIGKTVSKLGALGGPIGAAIGSLAGPLISGIAKLFGSVEKEVNKVRQAFVDSQGGLDALNRKAAAAGVTLKAMLDAKTPEAYKKAIDELNAAIQFQDDAMRFLDDTVKKYGFSIEELGPKFAQQELSKQAFDLQKEFKALEAAGIDVGVVSEHMKDAINDYLHAALKTGAEVPESMRAILQQLASMGLLTDANGDKIEDLESAGIHFSESLDQKFSTLLDTINKLVQAISRGLGVALDDLPKDVNVDVNVKYRTPGAGLPIPDFPYSGDLIDVPGLRTGGLVGFGGQVQHFATGGLVDSVPAMLTPGEMVLTKQQQLDLLGGHNDPALLAELRAIRQMLATQPDTVVQIDGVPVARAYHRVLDANVAGSLTDLREIAGMA